MNNYNEQAVIDICNKYDNDSTRMLDIVRDVQHTLRYVPSEAMDVIARETSSYRVVVNSVVSFYSFLSRKPKGDVSIRLCDDVIDRIKGAKEIAPIFAKELGIDFGETSEDGRFSLEYTSCIGMSDQAPAALFNDVVVTNITPESAKELIAQLKKHGDPYKLPKTLGDGNNEHELVQSMVKNNIVQEGPVIFGTMAPGTSLRNMLAMSPVQVISEIKNSGLCGRGGAGFPTGFKWELTRSADGDQKVVICNADEGEPGTFKDRVILTERADLCFEGMTVASYAMGAEIGILYLRAEYAYLKDFLEMVLERRRKAGLLGMSICGKKGFNFDIRIQMGAGAYICGEETSLISSCEGTRANPKNKPPFPSEKGYLGLPTSVNNVETFCCAARILDQGAVWFSELSPNHDSGTKLLSVSGDCQYPGTYEVPFGLQIADILERVGAENPIAVCVGGPSGELYSSVDFSRVLSKDDLGVSGTIMVFRSGRNLVKIVQRFLEFFIHETCGYCTPCRVGNVLLNERVNKILDGDGMISDLEYLRRLSETMKATSRCGLGQTSPNCVLSTLRNFKDCYRELITDRTNGMHTGFNLAKALADAKEIAGHNEDNH